MWNIWLTLNDNLFNHNNNPIPVKKTFADVAEYAFITDNYKTINKPTKVIYLKWEPTSQGFYKLNTDASVKSQSRPGRIWGIFRNYKGDWIMGYIKNVPHTNAQKIELLAILEGLRLAITHHLSPIEINSDSSNAIDMITSNHLGYCNIILECRYLIQSLGSPILRHTSREKNRVACALARTEIGNASFDQLQISFSPIMFRRSLGSRQTRKCFP